MDSHCIKLGLPVVGIITQPGLLGRFAGCLLLFRGWIRGFWRRRRCPGSSRWGGEGTATHGAVVTGAVGRGRLTWRHVQQRFAREFSGSLGVGLRLGCKLLGILGLERNATFQLCWQGFHISQVLHGIACCMSTGSLRHGRSCSTC